MNLRYLVPALGILVSSSGALFAENVGGLTVGGFVDTIGVLHHTDDGSDAGNAVFKGFASAVELRLGYKIGDKVTVQVDTEWNNGAYNGHDDTYLEQAYINYAISKEFSLTTGKYTTYAGWVAADADGLYRINSGPIVATYGGELVGVAGNFAPTDDLGISVFLVNGLDNVTDDSDNVGTSAADDTHLAIAVDAVYKVKDVGSFNVEGGYDPISADATYTELGVNATLKLASYQPLTLGAELIYNKLSVDGVSDDLTRIGFLAMGNHTINGAPFPMSGTLMFQFLKEDDATPLDTSSSAIDGDKKEISVALLTNPTSDSHFGVNAELAYEIDSPDGAGDDLKTITFALEAIAVIP